MFCLTTREERKTEGSGRERSGVIDCRSSRGDYQFAILPPLSKRVGDMRYNDRRPFLRSFVGSSWVKLYPPDLVTD